MYIFVQHRSAFYLSFLSSSSNFIAIRLVLVNAETFAGTTKPTSRLRFPLTWHIEGFSSTARRKKSKQRRKFYWNVTRIFISTNRVKNEWNHKPWKTQKPKNRNIFSINRKTELKMAKTAKPQTPTTSIILHSVVFKCWHNLTFIPFFIYFLDLRYWTSQRG